MIKVVHCQKDDYDVYIGREMKSFSLPQSKWHNPFKTGIDGTKEEVLIKYRNHVLQSPELMGSLDELSGLTLGCWCKPESCHGDVLVDLLQGKNNKRKMPFS